MSLQQLLVWGSVIGVAHFFVIGALYGNPWIDRLYQQAMQHEAGVKRWDSRPRYLLTQFLGTQVEIFALTLATLLFRPSIAMEGVPGAIVLGLVLSAVRVYPRFWNMWIQSTYPNRLLVIEAVNGVASTLVVTVGLELVL